LVIHKTISEQEHVILTTLHLAGAKNIDQFGSMALDEALDVSMEQNETSIE
jgi:hypothetical protein